MVSILLTVNGKTFSGTLYDNKTVRTFIELLPLTTELKDLNNNEKYGVLNESLPVQQEQVKSIKKGDLMLFGTDTFVLFYKSFTTTYPYTRLGVLDHTENLSSTLGKEKAVISVERIDGPFSV